MNNLKKFATEAEYQAASLNYPAVSWVTATDNVHFDKTAPTPTVNNKVMMAWHSPSDVPSGKDIVLYNNSSYGSNIHFNSLTLNDVDVMTELGDNGTLENYSVPNTDYVAKYELKDDSTITDIFSGDLGGGWGSGAQNIDFLIPSQVTEIQSIPNNTGNLVIESATPPTTSVNWSSVSPLIYVLDSAVNTYKSAIGWSSMSTNIRPISEYQGNLPV